MVFTDLAALRVEAGRFVPRELSTSLALEYHSSILPTSSSFLGGSSVIGAWANERRLSAANTSPRLR